MKEQVLFPTTEETTRRKRDRSREGAGKSENSHVKHKLVRSAVGAQLGAFRIRNRHSRIVLIDGNAGDGHGVEQPQGDLFGDNSSWATAELLMNIATRDGNADVILCESDPAKRSNLIAKYPQAIVLADNKLAPQHLSANYIYAIWVSDPCGPSGHGVAYMRAVADRIPRFDCVVVLNEGWITKRLAGTTDPRWKIAREQYLPMVSPEWWTKSLGRRRLSRTVNIIKGAPNFHYRVLIVSDHLSQGATRKPFEEAL